MAHPNLFGLWVGFRSTMSPKFRCRGLQLGVGPYLQFYYLAAFHYLPARLMSGALKRDGVLRLHPGIQRLLLGFRRLRLGIRRLRLGHLDYIYI